MLTILLLQPVFILTVMVSVLVRELGPLATALLVMARVGTAIVVRSVSKDEQPLLKTSSSSGTAVKENCQENIYRD